MTVVLKPPQRRLLPVGPVRIDWSHPLANGLIGCWLPGVSQGINLTGNIPDLAHVFVGTPKSPFSICSEGPAGSNPDVANSSMLSGNSIPALYNWPAQELSMYYRGDRNGAANGNTPYLILITYDNAWNGPYIVAGIQTAAGAADLSDLGLIWQNSGSYSQSAGANFNVPGTLSALATFRYGAGGQAILYKNGIAVNTNTYGSIGPSGANSKLFINGNAFFNQYSPTLPYLICIWNRQLTSTEALLLDADPYGFLIPAEGEMPSLSSPGIAPTTYIAFSVIQ